MDAPRPTSDPPDGYQWDYLGPDPNDQDGEKWGWINEAGEVWTPPAVVPTSELAADVRADALIAECESHAAVLSMPHTPFQVEQSVNFLVSTVPHVVRALVARITDLEAQAERRQRQLSELVRTARSEQVRANEAEAQVEYTDRALTNMTEWHNEAMARLKAAEAQVAALTTRPEWVTCDYQPEKREDDPGGGSCTQALAALGAQVAALTQERDTLLANIKDEAVQTILAKEYGSEQFHRAEAAEAALAEAQQERHEYGVWAEGKIATTRQALTDATQALSDASLIVEAEEDDWQVTVYRLLCRQWDIARRALAATDTNQTPESGKPVKGKGSSGK